jgi:hypothetical protein
MSAGDLSGLGRRGCASESARDVATKKKVEISLSSLNEAILIYNSI